MLVFCFLRDFVFLKLARKLHQVMLALFVGTILGGVPSPYGIVGFLLFFTTYFSTYIYNDLFDFEEDRKRSCYSEKVLVHGVASEKEFLAILGNLSVVSAFLVTLWNPVLGFLSVLAVILNNVRTHVSGVVKRQMLLSLVELINFEAFWLAFYGTLIPSLFIPLFVAYSAMYSTAHGVYRLRHEKELLRIVKTREMKFLILFTIFAVVFALPSLVLSLYHFIVLLVATAMYFIPQRMIVSKMDLGAQDDVRVVEKSNLFLTCLITLTLFFSTVYYIFSGFPLRSAVPFEEQLVPFYSTAEYFDKLQDETIRFLFGGLDGLEGKITEKNVASLVT